MDTGLPALGRRASAPPPGERMVRETAPTLKEMAPGERPQERLEALGAGR